MEAENLELSQGVEIDEQSFEDAWNDESLSDALGGEAEGDGADQTDTEAEASEGETSKAEGDGADQNDTESDGESFTLRYMQEDKKYSKADTVALAQKGLDYDRIREERDSIKNELPSLREMRDFLKELADDGNVSIEQLMEDVRTERLVRQENEAGRTISHTGAREQIKREKGARTENKDGNVKGTANTGAKRDNDKEIRDFCKAYPNVKANEIPQSVWDEVNAGMTLSTAYARYENTKLKEELTKLKQSDKNKGRSTGSKKTAGGSTPKSAFDLAWDATEF